METNVFLVKNREDAKFNQYWYSKQTIEFIANEAVTNGKCAAFLSVPSVYFSITNPTFRAASRVFDVP